MPLPQIYVIISIFFTQLLGNSETAILYYFKMPNNHQSKISGSGVFSKQDECREEHDVKI